MENYTLSKFEEIIANRTIEQLSSFLFLNPPETKFIPVECKYQVVWPIGIVRTFYNSQDVKNHLMKVYNSISEKTENTV